MLILKGSLYSNIFRFFGWLNLSGEKLLFAALHPVSQVFNIF